MRVKLEVGGWRLVEDDSGEIRLWSHLESGETKDEDDVPDEVRALLYSEEDAPTSIQSPAQPDQRGGDGEALEEPRPQPPSGLHELPVKKPNLKLLTSVTKQCARTDKPPTEVLSKITHLFLAEKSLTVVGDCVHQYCHALKVLHLENNHLHDMGRLPEKLETLQLEGNSLWEMGSWSQKLPKLEILDLRENNISVLEGLQTSSNIRQLVLRGQRNASQTGLRFSSRTLQAIAPGLRFLDIARNHLTDISPLSRLFRLERLDASHNAIPSVEDAAAVVQAMPELGNLSLEGNPLFFAAGRRYRDEIILVARNLQELDGKPVGRTERAFLGELDKRRRRGGRSARGPSAPPRLAAGPPYTPESRDSRPRSHSKSMLPPAGAPGGLPPLPGRRQAQAEQQAMPRMAAQRRQRSVDRI